MIDPDGGMSGPGDGDPIVLDEVIITASGSPNFKFPQGNQYPAFFNFLNNTLPNALKDDLFANTLSEISGHSIEKLREIFTSGEGPTLTVGGTFADGEFPALGDPNADPEEILLGEEFVQSFQSGNLDGTTEEGLVNILNAAVVICHEVTHHGDYHNTGGARYRAGQEPGYDFEDRYIRNFRVGDQLSNRSGARLYVQDNLSRLGNIFGN